MIGGQQTESKKKIDLIKIETLKVSKLNSYFQFDQTGSESGISSLSYNFSLILLGKRRTFLLRASSKNRFLDQISRTHSSLPKTANKMNVPNTCMSPCTFSHDSLIIYQMTRQYHHTKWRIRSHGTWVNPGKPVMNYSRYFITIKYPQRKLHNSYPAKHDACVLKIFKRFTYSLLSCFSSWPKNVVEGVN